MSLLGMEREVFVKFENVNYKMGSVEALLAVEKFITDYLENPDNDLVDMQTEKSYLRSVIPSAMFGSARQDFDYMYSVIKIKRLQKVFSQARCCGNCKHKGAREWCKLKQAFVDKGYGERGCKWELRSRDK